MNSTAPGCNGLEPVDDVERGLAMNEFFLVFQPKLRLPEGRLSGFEALLRWAHPTRGILLPSSFIDVVEDSRLTARFTDFLLLKAAQTLSNWAALGYDALSLSINLPAREFAREGLADQVVHTFDAYGVDADRLQIELTETTEPGPHEALVAAIDSIRKTGVGVAIDDFGAGYWSLILLRRLAVDVLKLDRSLIKEVAWNSESKVILESLVRLGQHLGKQVVIEGIETQAQFECAKAFSQVDGQGYYISLPVPAEQVDGLVAKHGLVQKLRHV